MFSVWGSAGKLCDGWTRRKLLTVGGLSLLQFSLADLLRVEARGAAPAPDVPATAASIVGAA